MNNKEFTKIVDRTKKIVLSAVSRYLYCKYYNLIDDVVQETYLRAYKGLVKNSFRRESDISTWLHIIAKNESIRMNIKMLKEELKKEKYKGIAKKEHYDDHDENLILNNMRKLISMLPLRYFMIFKLFLEGNNDQQIAESLSLPVGTVKSRLNRGKKILKKINNKECRHEQNS